MTVSAKNTYLVGAAALLVEALAGCDKNRLDQEVRELCVKDGGIKVYEKVKLASNKFSAYGLARFYRPANKEMAHVGYAGGGLRARLSCGEAIQPFPDPYPI